MFAKKQIGIALFAMLTAVLFASTCFAAEGETVKIQGVVSVTRGANDAITAVQVATDAGTYNVELDAKGTELGEAAESVKADVEGVVTEKDGQKWLKVTTFTIAAPEVK